MEIEYTLLYQLRPFEKNNYKIFVRLWDVYQLGNTETSSYAMILIDEKGFPIHASLPSTNFEKYKDKLQEGLFISLSDFEVETKDKNYCPLNKPFKIKFNDEIKVSEQSAPAKFPKQIFVFTDFNNLEDKVEKPALLLDFAGLLTKVEMKSTKLKTRAGESPKQDMYIQNERGEEIRIVFWGRSLELLTPILIATENETVVVVTSLIVKKFKDIYLQATYAPKIYIGYDIPQATALINSPKKNPSKRSLVEENKNIKEIVQMAYDGKKPVRAECVGTIAEVCHDKRFYYDACTTCKFGVNRDFEEYWCFKCQKLIPKPMLRLRLQFQIEDETGQKVVSAFEEVAQTLVGKSLDELITLSLEFAGDIAVKDALNEIVGKKLKFEIRIADFNLSHLGKPFTDTKFYDWAEPSGKKMKVVEKE